MIELRNGQATTDRRLDRVRHVDLRNLNYPVREVLAPAQRRPRSYTWQCDARLDQGQEGACVGFGWSCELAARPAVVPVDDTFAKEKIYWGAQLIDQWPGGSYPGASPIYEGTAVQAGAEVCKQLGYITEYRWALDIRDLALAVGYLGPAVIGVDWYKSMFNPDGAGLLHPSGEVAGGHCVCILGVTIVWKDAKAPKGWDNVDQLRSTFLLQNSWGRDWGHDGRARITFAEMLVLWPGGDFCIPMHRQAHALQAAA